MSLCTSRRTLLKSALASAGVAFGMPLFVPSRLFGAEAPSNRINLGFIGPGSRGMAVLGNFLRVPHMQVVAVSDCFEERRTNAVQAVDRAAGGKVCTAYRDFRDLLARPDIDGVVIATPDHWHVPIGILAARAGKDMYIEKPLGMSVEQDFAMREAVRRHQRVFQYGTQQRSMGHIHRGCQLIRNGRLGKLSSISVIAPSGLRGGSTVPEPVPPGFDYDMFRGPAPERPYTRDLCRGWGGSFFVSDQSLGFIGGWGAHPLDVMSWALGDTMACVPVEISGRGDIPTEGLYDTPVTWKLTGRLADGTNWSFGTGTDCTTFVGERGTISLSRGAWSCDPISLWYEDPLPGETALPVSTDHSADFVNAIRERRDPVSSIDGAVYSDLITQLSYIAVVTGRPVRWDPVACTIPGDEGQRRMLRRAMRGPWTL